MTWPAITATVMEPCLKSTVANRPTAEERRETIRLFTFAGIGTRALVWPTIFGPPKWVYGYQCLHWFSGCKHYLNLAPELYNFMLFRWPNETFSSSTTITVVHIWLVKMTLLICVLYNIKNNFTSVQGITYI